MSQKVLSGTYSSGYTLSATFSGLYVTATGAYAALNPASDALQPYTGYWVFAYRPTALSLPPPGH